MLLDSFQDELIKIGRMDDPTSLNEFVNWLRREGIGRGARTVPTAAAGVLAHRASGDPAVTGLTAGGALAGAHLGRNVGSLLGPVVEARGVDAFAKTRVGKKLLTDRAMSRLYGRHGDQVLQRMFGRGMRGGGAIGGALGGGAAYLLAKKLRKKKDSKEEKTAGLLRPRGDKLTERLLAAGSLSGAMGHAATKAKAGMSGEYGPEGTIGGAAIKGGVGGLLAALGLKGLSRMGRRRL